MQRYDIINTYISHYNFCSYLEIGTRNRADNFDKINCKNKKCIDPDIHAKADFVMTSDEYFKYNNEKFDIIFIDGLHECHQVNRDIKNSLLNLNKNGVIIMHDCHPESEELQRSIYTFENGIFPGNIPWFGDCWKAFIKNRAELPYEMYVCDYDCGCGVIDTNATKTSDTSYLPTNMEQMTYENFIKYPEWMNFKKEIILL